MASNALTPIVYQLQEGLRSSFDLNSWSQDVDVGRLINHLDFKTVGWLALAAVTLIYLFSFFSSSLVPFGRNLAITAADAWDNRQLFGLGQRENSSRSLVSLTGVLDALAEAVKKWEEPQDTSSEMMKF